MCPLPASLMRRLGPDTRGAEMVGQSSALTTVLEQVRLVARTDSTVLILGETGTGKELIARSIHSMSDRADRPFVKVNCAAMPFDLLESELFGHERGAFTGAVAQRPGRFEIAHGGTLFLDEIGDMPLASQPKLLRVLQEGEFERVGSSRTQHVDVRLVAATHRDLKAMARSNEFRSDLYYRLNVFPVMLPPLRERRDDIVPLIRHFIEFFSRRLGKEITCIPHASLLSLIAHDWPGNIRELQNVIERAIILSQDGVFPELRGLMGNEAIADTAAHPTPRFCERDLIVKTLRETNWVVGGARGAAVKLGIKRTTLIARMKKFGIACEVRPREVGSEFWTDYAADAGAMASSITLPVSSMQRGEDHRAPLN
ncbi:MAG TPA: sigma 54-interacting transcriptional regulator [Acidobacteriaceae bacterium]